VPSLAAITSSREQTAPGGQPASHPNRRHRDSAGVACSIRRRSAESAQPANSAAGFI